MTNEKISTQVLDKFSRIEIRRFGEIVRLVRRKDLVGMILRVLIDTHFLQPEGIRPKHFFEMFPDTKVVDMNRALNTLLKRGWTSKEKLRRNWVYHRLKPEIYQALVEYDVDHVMSIPFLLPKERLSGGVVPP